MEAIKFDLVGQFDNRDQVVNVDALVASGVKPFCAGARYIAKYDGVWKRWMETKFLERGRYVEVGPFPDDGKAYLYQSWDYSPDATGPSDIGEEGFENHTLKFIVEDEKTQAYAACLYDEENVAVFTVKDGLVKTLIGIVKLGEEFHIQCTRGRKPAIVKEEQGA